MAAIPVMRPDPIGRAFGRIFKRPEPLTVSQWADRHRLMVDKEAVERGRWKTDRTPYLRGVMDAMDSPYIRRVTIRKGERVGGTEAVLNALYYRIDRRPGNVLWVYPNLDVAQQIVSKRIIPTVREVPELSRHLGVSPRDLKVLEIEFDRMTLRSAGSNSESRLEASGYVMVVVDERDRCVPNVVDTVRGRVATYPDHLIVTLGTPTDEMVGIDADYHEGDMRQFHVPCTRCGVFFVRQFEQFKWNPGPDNDVKKADPADVAREAWCRCPACNGRIEGYENLDQLRGGLWVPDACCVDVVDGKPVAVHKSTGEEWKEGSTGPHASFDVSGFLNPFQSNIFGYIASEWVGNGGHASRDWVNRRCGQPYTTQSVSKKLKASELRVLCTQLEHGGYKLGVVPAPSGLTRAMVNDPAELAKAATQGLIRPESGVLALSAGVDVQNDRVYVEVVGWSAAGERCWLIDFREIPRRQGDELRSLAEWIDGRTYPVINPRTGEDLGRIGVTAVGVDSGHYTDEVYAFCGPRAARSVFSTKGYQVLLNDQKLIEWSDIDPDPNGKTAWAKANATKLLRINTNRFKTVIADAIVRGLGDPKGSEVRFPEDAPETLLEHLVSEERRPGKLVRGVRKFEWALRPGRTQNHGLDCRVINHAIAQAMNVSALKVGYLVQQLLRSMDPNDKATPTTSAAVSAGGGSAGGRVIGRIGKK